MTGGKTSHTWLDRPVAELLRLDAEKLLYGLILLVALVTRFYDLGTRVMSHDESLHTYYSWQLYQGRGFQHTPLMHGPLQFHMLALTYFIFGDSDFSARVPAALFGVAAVGLIYFFRRWLGRSGALVAAVLVTVSPYLLYYSRYTRNEAFVVVWALLAAWATFRFLETRQPKWLVLLASATVLHAISKETSFIYVAIWLIGLDLLLLRQLLSVPWDEPNFRRTFGWLLLASALAAVVALVCLQAARYWGEAPTDPVGVIPLAERLRDTGIRVGIAGAALLAVAHLTALASFRARMRAFAPFELMIVLGTLILPQLTAFPVHWLGGDPIDYASKAQLVQTGAVLGVLVVLAIGMGVLWNWRRWLVCAGIWYGLFIPFQTTIFTNSNGFWTGMVGSLGYWVAQQAVERGSQPWYYYVLVQLPIYEFLPVIGAMLALAYATRDVWLASRNRAPLAAGGEIESESEDDVLIRTREPIPAIAFFGLWALLAIVAFSMAGEKMPWLTVHMTLPLILLSGWSFGRLIDGIPWASVWHRRGWIMALLLPVLLTSTAFMILHWISPDRPFQGKELEQLRSTFQFLAVLLVAVIAAAGIYFAGRDTAWEGLDGLTALTGIAGLGLVTVRAALAASFVNYDRATEYLVYAHSAAGVKTVMGQVEALSRRTTDSLDIVVAYDDDVSWPMTWYLRNFRQQRFYGGQPTRDLLQAPVIIAGDNNWSKVEPLLGDAYNSYEYIRMWWPMQEYFGLTGERVWGALALAEYRQALWSIWWNRDYTRYGQLNGVNYDLASWPVVDRMRFYVRKDLAAQMWDFGPAEAVSQPGVPTAETDGAEVDLYAAGRRVLAAELVWGAPGSGAGEFNLPRGVAVGPDGSIYVADSGNHRIQKFDVTGAFQLEFGDQSVGDGQPAAGTFNEPWGVSVAPDGSVYVADTWNHRIQKFTANGTFVTAWGHFGQGDAPDAFWGPRGVVVDATGRVFVADTGNKRVVAFDGNGQFLFEVGQGAGYEAGSFDEPVGLALGPQGQLFVADTWNRRVQVFAPDAATGGFVYQAQWTFGGWLSQSVDNKPYLAAGSDSRVFVSDPEGYRIVAFDSQGAFLFTWGGPGTDAMSFGLPQGVAIDKQGRVLVVDASNSRIMRFVAAG